MLPTVLAGERGWLPYERCHAHAVSNKQDVDPWRHDAGQKENKEAYKAVKDRNTTVRAWSHSM